MLKTLIRGALVAGAFALSAASSAFAGPQFIDASGYAVSGYDVVAYHSLGQGAVGAAQPAAVPGRKEFTTEYNGAQWAFSSQENLDKFKADPAKYAPAYDGHCAYGAARGGKVNANPNLWRIIDGVLYLNTTNGVVRQWEKDISGNIVKADKNWTKLESKASPTNAARGFDTTQAPI